MSKVNPVAGPRETAGAHSTAQTKTPVDPKVRKAAQEFEAMFVRQILTAAKIGGHDKQNGYDGMAVDAIQRSVLDELQRFTRGAHQSDDITLLVVRYRTPA